MISCFSGKFRLTSVRGWRRIFGYDEFHKGIDLVGIDDIAVRAIADGTIDATPYEADGFGYYIRQKLPDGRRIYYGHLAADSVCVKPGEKVRKGQKLGIMGSTGKVTGAHTHLEIRPAGTGSDSMDISAFTLIPNRIGTYTASPYHSSDPVVERLVIDGVTTPENVKNWERMLQGKSPLRADYTRILFERYSSLLKGIKK